MRMRAVVKAVTRRILRDRGNRMRERTGKVARVRPRGRASS
jgi:hypothetical protein